MRILMLDNELPPKGGGMGTANMALLRRFAAIPELEIDLITSSLDGVSCQEAFSDRIRIYKVPVGKGNIHHASNIELIRYAWEAVRVAGRMCRRKNYDFCFAWSAVPAGAVALALQKIHGLPFMTWVSGPDIPGFEKRYDYIFPLLRPLLKQVWQRSQPLIAKCQEEVELLHREIPGWPITILPNGVDLSQFKPGMPIPDEGPLIVVCAARLIERKGQRQLIKAARQLKDEGIPIILNLLGEGDSTAAYQDLVRSLEVEDRVFFKGFVSPDDIPNHYASAHVFALPSYFEGMSLATLEAMACGLPIVVTPTGGVGELVLEGENGFTFEWEDVEMLTQHLRTLAQNRCLARQMGAMAKERAEIFAWEGIALKYLVLFEELRKNRLVDRQMNNESG